MPARWDAKAMEALKEGHDTSKMRGPQRIDIMSKISDAIADECLANDVSVIEWALALLDTRGAHALSGPTLYMEYWDSEEDLDETVVETDYFEYSSEPRCNQLPSITRFEKVVCALLNATTRVCQAVPTWYKFEGHLALIGEALDLEQARVKRMLWCIQDLHYTVVPFCVVSNFWAICRGEEPKEDFEQMLLACVNLMYPEHKDLIKLAKAAEGPNTIMFQEKLGLNRNKLTSIIMYLLCTSYAPNGDALSLYTSTNWKTEKRRGALNRLWRVMNSTEPATKLFDGSNVSDILPPLGKDKEKACIEGPVPNNPVEAEGEQEQPAVEEHISREITPEPGEAQDDEKKFLGADDPIDKEPSAPKYVAPTRRLPKIIHKKCRVYCDLSAQVKERADKKLLEETEEQYLGRLVLETSEKKQKAKDRMLLSSVEKAVERQEPSEDRQNLQRKRASSDREPIAMVCSTELPMGHKKGRISVTIRPSVESQSKELCREIYAMESALSKYPYRKIVQWSTGIQSSIECIFCGSMGTHYSDSCPVVVEGYERLQVAMAAGRRLQCLKLHEGACTSKEDGCWYCRQLRETPLEDIIPQYRHHRALFPVPHAKRDLHEGISVKRRELVQKECDRASSSTAGMSRTRP
nr:unnamed protein product [Haemonchus contortus]